MVLDWNEYLSAARLAAAEGCVLLKNEHAALPLVKGGRVAVFGRIQRHYYKSGTGSGGLVNVSHVTGILDALLETPDVIVDADVLAAYDAWEVEHEFDEGEGWAKEPWSQVEMPLEEELLETAGRRNDAALVIIGRTAGEDRDHADEKGSYRLADAEVEMLERVRAHFERVIVLFNVGNIIETGHPCLQACDALLYVWQGGMTGGYGVADVLTGAVNPSGRLADTIAGQIGDYPSARNFGDEVRNYYQEDIYVGYRYFETMAKHAVLYPFGYGLSYTEFEETVSGWKEDHGDLSFSVDVTNSGAVSGKQVVQVYVEAPQGVLGKPSRVLAAFAKTEELRPGETASLPFHISCYDYASYDDSGVTGRPYCYVLEPGTYRVYIGKNVRDARCSGQFSLDSLHIVQELAQNLAPPVPFERMRPQVPGAGGAEEYDGFGSGENEGSKVAEIVGFGNNAGVGDLEIAYEPVPAGGEQEAAKRKGQIPPEIPYTGDKGYRLRDVDEGTVSMEQFIAQFSDDDLCCIIRGEGMNSPKVAPGTAAAYGGVSEHLKSLGIPCGCCSDGPSGIRRDSGEKAFSLPNGTLMACTFDLSLIQKLYSFTGAEMVSHHVDNLLGPGVNIHRHPLNGRNFEYFSEDPFLTGKMAAAVLRGLKSAGVTGTLKHFAANNQETKRMEIDSVVSERALREIYLKGFEIAVKEGGADSIMTTYGSLNGVWTAGRFELNTEILRNEWGFEGIVMTDWWAKISRQGQSEKADKTDLAAMAMAQNDLYMVCEHADQNAAGDNTLKELQAGVVTRGELQRNAANICRQLMTTPAFQRFYNSEGHALKGEE